MTIPRRVVLGALGHVGKIVGVSRRMEWDGKELRHKTMAGQPYNGGLFVEVPGAGLTFVANSEYGKTWHFRPTT